MGRKQAREGTMKLLYQMELNEDFSQEAIDRYLFNFTFDKKEEEYILDMTNKIKDNLEVIDEHIENHIKGWGISRLAKIDLAVLRIAICEVLYREDIPIQVSINEAIEIVKKYSLEDSFKFVNGVLGGFVRAIDNTK